MQFLVIALIAIAAFAILAAAALNARREIWKKCRKCGWWYSDRGEISTTPPALRYPHPTDHSPSTDFGICADCFRKKVDLRKQQPKERNET